VRDLACAGPHYRLVRRIRSGHSEVAWRYRILSSLLNLHAPRMRTCVRECMRECVRSCVRAWMRSRPAVGVVRRETRRRLHGRIVLCVPSSSYHARRKIEGANRKSRSEWLRSCGQKVATRRALGFIYDIISEESAAPRRAARAVAIWSYGRVTR
jgi:hypothetical protein